MSNQRKKTKKYRGSWQEDVLISLSNIALKKKGLEYTEFEREILLKLIDEQLTKEEINEITEKQENARKD